jgi:subtilisin-like proprotein convertase family protein
VKRILIMAVFFLVWAGPAHGATKSYSSGNLRLAIPDGGVLQHSIRVPDRGPIRDLSVAIRLNHPRDSDLTLTLVSPSGTEVVLARKQGGGGSNFGNGPRSCKGNATVLADGGTPLTDDAPPFVEYELNAPEQPLRRLRGEQAKGRWTLRIEDDTTGKAGTLYCWSLELSRDVTEYRRAGRDGVRAVLSYKGNGIIEREARLLIVRRGKPALDIPLRRLSNGTRVVRLFVRDLDADRDPEVVLDFYTGGAHCCTQSLIYRYERVRRRYRRTLHDWGNAFPAYRIVDPNHDGHPELRSVDDRFAYVFTSFAGSLFPVRIWRFEEGRLRDVTRRFPRIVGSDSVGLWRTYLSLRREHTDVRGALAAWLADEYLLGREEEGWRRLEAAYRRGELGPAGYGWPAGRAYLRALRAYLRTLGYAR